MKSQGGKVIKINSQKEIEDVNEILDKDFFYETEVSSELAEKLLSLVKKENVDMYIIGVDTYGNFYTEEYENATDTSYITLESSIHKYDIYGNEVGYAIYSTDDSVSYLRKPIKIDENGNIYLMLCEQEEVGIYKVILGTGDKSSLQEKASAYEDKTNVKKTETKQRSSTYSSRTMSLTRYQVFLRAYQMEKLRWTVSLDNKDTSSLSNVSLPSYVANAKVGEVLFGIPYCWGGYNGYETISSSVLKTRFVDVCTRDIVAGNVKATGNYKTGTAGLDCSGFVASAYGCFTTKPSTSNLASYGTPISYDELRYMDFMVKSGSHVVLFNSVEVVDGIEMYNIFDASTDTGKVSYRSVKKSYLSGYQARTVWSD